MYEKIKKGSSVMITSITKTRLRHGLDSGGIMQGMVGKVHKVAGRDGNRVFISRSARSFQYSWHIDDMHIIDEKEPDPIIFKFDEKQLVI